MHQAEYFRARRRGCLAELQRVLPAEANRLQKNWRCWLGDSENEEMKGPKPHVSVIVPCYNERDNVESCVEQIGETLSAARIPFEILVVNDGSTDDTLERANSLSTSCSFVRVVDLGRNCGKAVALREGIRRASGDVVAFFDADLQYSPEDLVTMITKLGMGIDFVN